MSVTKDLALETSDRKWNSVELPTNQGGLLKWCNTENVILKSEQDTLWEPPLEQSAPAASFRRSQLLSERHLGVP